MIEWWNKAVEWLESQAQDAHYENKKLKKIVIFLLHVPFYMALPFILAFLFLLVILSDPREKNVLP